MEKVLTGRTVLVTRGEEHAVESKQLLEDAGAHALLYPTIGFRGEPLPDEICEQISEGYFDYVFFTSQNAVTYFLQSYRNTLALNIMTTVAAVGKKTAAKLHDQNVQVAIVPEEQSAAGMLAAIAHLHLQGCRALIPCSDIAREELAEGLRALGMDVVTPVVYKTGFPPVNITHEANKTLKQSMVDAFLFTSPSTFKNFLVLAGVHDAAYFTDKVVVGIGPTTVQELKNFGLRNILQPSETSMRGMIAVLEEYFTMIEDKKKLL